MPDSMPEFDEDDLELLDELTEQEDDYYDRCRGIVNQAVDGELEHQTGPQLKWLMQIREDLNKKLEEY